MSELLRLENIHKAYRMGPAVVPVLRGVNLKVQDGEFVAIMGASGSGKSTLLHIAGALDHPGRENGAAGEVYFRKVALSSMSRHEAHQLRNRQFGFVFQFYHLLPELNVLENVLLPAMVERTPRWLLYGLFVPALSLLGLGLIAFLVWAFDPLPLFWLAGLLCAAVGLGVTMLTGLGVLAFNLYKLFIRRNPKKHDAIQLLEAFGLTARLKHRPAELSGGERQRVAIARALINKPALLLADEPTGNLDAKTGRTILDVLLKLHKERGQTILLVTHDPQVAALADRIVQLEEGRIRAA